MNQNQRTADAIRALVRDAENEILAIIERLQEDTGMRVHKARFGRDVVRMSVDGERVSLSKERVTIDLRL